MKYKERLLVEFKQLVGRIELLNNALNSDNRDKIDRDQLDLMEKQLNCMCQYEDVLFTRLLNLLEK